MAGMLEARLIHLAESPTTEGHEPVAVSDITGRGETPLTTAEQPERPTPQTTATTTRATAPRIIRDHRKVMSGSGITPGRTLTRCASA